MKKREWNKGKKMRMLCLLMAMLLLVNGIPVTAAEFGSGDEREQFSSGDPDDGYTGVGQEEESDVISADLAVQNPGDSNKKDTSVNPISTVTPEPSLSPTPSVSPSPIPTVSPVPSVSPTPSVTPDNPNPPTDPDEPLKIGTPVTIRFANNSGTAYYEELQIETKIGDSVIIPNVPEAENRNGSGWKMEKDIPDDQAIVLEGGEPLALTPDDNLSEYIMNGVLTLYAVEGEEMCTVTFYNNSGTAAFSGGTLTIPKGTTIILPDYQSNKYVNYGWTSEKGGRDVQYELGEKVTVNVDLDLYIIRYAVSKIFTVKFVNQNGSSNSTFRTLNVQVVKGTKIKLPAVPVASGYANLGWATKKKATKASYLAGGTVTVNKNITFYAVRKKTSSACSVTFNNNSGTSTSKVYAGLKQRVAKNSYIILPDLPKAAGYENIGWTTTLKGTKPIYKAGTKIRVTKNMKFYTVRRKNRYYSVYFYYGNGTSDDSYKRLKMNVEDGTTIILPSVPLRAGYENQGWSLVKNSSSNVKKEGTKYKVTSNVAFYSVQKQSVSVYLHKSNGAYYKTISVGKGDTVTLPSVSSLHPYTFMGWSRSLNQTVAPEYEAREMIRVDSNIHLYAVMFNRDTQERDYQKEEMARPDTIYKYKKVIFVGDSRTRRMRLTLENQFGSEFTQGVSFIAKEGGGLSWLQGEGYLALMNEIGNGSTSILDKPIAVVFNLGVNDLSYVNSYVTYLNDLAGQLKAKGCKLFYMSVNPVNSKILASTSHPVRYEESVRMFNSTIRSSLCSGNPKKMGYIDTYSKLMDTGFGFDSSTTGVDRGVDDGLHYTTKTYKRIYNYCIDALNRG